NSRTEIDWSPGETHAPALIRQLMEIGWPAGTLLNMNFPACSAEQVAGVVLVPQGQYDLQSTEIEQRIDVRQRAYYWIGLRRHHTIPPEDSDIGALAANKIAVTPLHLNLTEHAVLSKMRAALAGDGTLTWNFLRSRG
ncbi:MAG TPA: hypothetical protein VHV26_14805, partial [Rhizomicrobium sp.]|nr:hypothetical protein [Rhizomicrobium sp.]